MAIAYKPPVFEIKPFTDDEIVFHLHNKVKKLADMGDMNTANNLDQYLNNRQEYKSK